MHNFTSDLLIDHYTFKIHNYAPAIAVAVVSSEVSSCTSRLGDIMLKIIAIMLYSDAPPSLLLCS